MAKRPQTLKEFHGQNHLKEQMCLAINAAKIANKPVGHMLFTGRSGNGKTTLANIVANERGVDFCPIIATSIKTDDDLKEILVSKLNADGYANDSPNPINLAQTHPTVLFIDEIHNLKRRIFETLYTVLEDRTYWEEEKDAWSRRQRKIKAFVPGFTLIGATTREGSLDKPFLDRFTYKFKLESYTDAECIKFVLDTLNDNNIKLANALSALKIARRARGCARVAIQLTTQCIDLAIATGKPILSDEMIDQFFLLSGIDEFGLTPIDRKILVYLNSANRPLGVAALAAYLEETKSSLEEHYEPYLVVKEFIGRTPSGRAITERGKQYLEYKGLIDRQDGKRYLHIGGREYHLLPEIFNERK